MDMAVDQASTRHQFRSPLIERLSKSRSMASWGLVSVRDLADPVQQALIVQRRSGCIVTCGGSLVAIHARWWPYHGNLLMAALESSFRTLPADVCELYYHQPAGMPDFLTLSYARAGAITSLATLYAASQTLDEIARLRKTGAIVCHVTNSRISDRLLHRWGWQAHCLHWRGRHFIKRFSRGVSSAA